MKRPIIIANWKMNLGTKESVKLIKSILKKLKKIKGLDIVFCPSFISLSSVCKIFKSKFNHHLYLGAQDCFWEEQGNFTGEVSPYWLKKLGCKYVIIGHSERRHNLKETDEMVYKKVRTALQAGLIPIICVGETLDERHRGIKDYVVLNQVSEALSGIDLNSKQNIIIAYEPVWVIGSGRAVMPEEAEYMNRIILQKTIDLYPLSIVQNNIRIIYGGSVDSENIKSFINQETISGSLVGKASLDAKEFVKICKKVVV